MKRRKDVNQGGHLRDFKLRICLNGIEVSSEITSPASCLCKLQLVCRRLHELTPYVHCMAPADGLYWVQVLMYVLHCNRLVGLVVRRPPRERKVPGSNPACAGIFSGPSHTSALNIGTPVVTLPGAWRYRVSAGTGRPGVSIL